MLSRLLAPVALAAVLTSASDVHAAEPQCARISETYGTCLVELPTSPARPEIRPIGAGAAEPGFACSRSGQPIACSDPALGQWSSSNGCYLRRADPQPPPSSPLWQGRYPDGAIYDCIDPESGPYSGGARFWLPTGAESGMTPEQAAQALVRRMDLRAADIGIVPEDRPGSVGAVGAPVYMWTTASPQTFGPQTLIGSAGGITITATARVDRVVWSMGDGATVICRTAGTPYEDRYGFKASPDCGHRYSRSSIGLPGDAFPIVATSFWVIDWTGPGGSSGRINLDLTSRTQIQVGELQALVTR
jgi:hypothetical protein